MHGSCGHGRRSPAPYKGGKTQEHSQSDCATAKRRIGAARCAGKEMLSEGRRDVREREARCAAFFPDTGVAELEIEILAVPGFFARCMGTVIQAMLPWRVTFNSASSGNLWVTGGLSAEVD